MKILFSAVGTEQPVKTQFDTETGERIAVDESALILLCRQEQPAEVWLYLTGDALDAEEANHGWVNTLALLGAELGTMFNVKTVKRPVLSVPLNEDLYGVLSEIRANAPDAELYVDLMSGTPEQLDALRSLFAEPSLRLHALPEEAAPVIPEAPAADIQPEVPADDNFAEVEANADTETEEPVFPTKEPAFSEEPVFPAEEPAVSEEILPEEPAPAVEAVPEASVSAAESAQAVSDAVRDNSRTLLKALIDGYQYSAAQLLCTQISDLSPEFTTMLDAAVLRSSGRFMDAQRKFQSVGQNALMPAGSGAAEYYLLLDLYVRSGRYTDFLRAIQPYLLEILMDAVRKQFNMDVSQYMTYGTKRWDHNKLMIAQMTGKFKESYNYHTKPKPGTLGVYVTTANLSNLMENLSVPKTHGQLILDTMKLRLKAEENLRTLTSYTMQGATAQEIQAACMHTPEELLGMLQNYTLNYTNIKLDDQYLQSYQNMNAALKALL